LKEPLAAIIAKAMPSSMTVRIDDLGVRTDIEFGNPRAVESERVDLPRHPTPDDVAKFRRDFRRAMRRMQEPSAHDFNAREPRAVEIRGVPAP